MCIVHIHVKRSCAILMSCGWLLECCCEVVKVFWVVTIFKLMYLFFGSGRDFDSSQSHLNLLNKKVGSD